MPPNRPDPARLDYVVENERALSCRILAALFSVPAMAFGVLSLWFGAYCLIDGFEKGRVDAIELKRNGALFLGVGVLCIWLAIHWIRYAAKKSGTRPGG